MNKVSSNSKYCKILTKKYLIKYYYINGSTWIAQKIGCNRGVVNYYLKKYNLKTVKISERGRKIKSKKTKKRMLGNTPWNKNMDMWKENPESVLKMKRKLAGRRLNKKGEFQKGHKNSLKKRRDFVCKHHKDLNTKNNHPDNLMYLKNPPHNSLHKRAYDFLVEKNLIKEYINWFVKNFKPVLYTKNQRIKINKKVTSELRAEKGGDAKC